MIFSPAMYKGQCLLSCLVLSCALTNILGSFFHGYLVAAEALTAKDGNPDWVSVVGPNIVPPEENSATQYHPLMHSTPQCIR